MKSEKVAKFVKDWRTILGGAFFLYVLLLAAQTSAFDFRYVKTSTYDADNISAIRSDISIYKIRRDFARDRRDRQMMEAIINQLEDDIKRLKGE